MIKMSKSKINKLILGISYTFWTFPSQKFTLNLKISPTFLNSTVMGLWMNSNLNYY